MCNNCNRGSEFMNPFECAPFPNMIQVGRGEDEPYIQLWSNGKVELYNDPLDHPIATFTPDDAELMKFIASHLEHYRLEAEEQAKHKPPEPPAKLKVTVIAENGNGHNANGKNKPGDKVATGDTSAGMLADGDNASGTVLIPNGQPKLDQRWLDR